MESNSSDPFHHVVLFPYMAKGHTIPILHLARLLLRRPHMAVTVFTTPSNRPFVADSLADTAATIIDLPFPDNVPNLPAGIESTDKLPSMSLFVPFSRATKLMQPDFERELEILPRVSFMVSDGFLWWTLESATKFGFPRLVFYGMSCYSSSLGRVVAENRLLLGPESDYELIAVSRFPWIKVTRNDFEKPFCESKPEGPHFEFVTDTIISGVKSFGMIFNTFYELEPTFVDYWKGEPGSKSWLVGPLCLAEQPRDPQPGHSHQKPTWIQWLDQKLDQGNSVLYIAFGSQTEISPQQLKEIATGLEESKVNFLWVMREKESKLGDGFDSFEERVKGRGIVVRNWVNQREILMHQSVQGFLSHCGWNSVLESICAGVPILAWPMLAEQPLNARMIAEEIKVGLRVETCDGSVKGFVKWEGLEKKVRELMEGEKGKEVRKKVKEFAEMSKKAMEEKSGSSWQNLDMLINETCNCNKKDVSC